ncbi:MAG: J domain-containing protein [Nitrospirae bacterium]|jgi:curved DNA-binding protein CbpA|nr:J domain-containing protein [Nitrospirota bacterium]
MHPDDQEFVKKVEGLYKKLNYSDYYSILGIEKWATLDKIKKAYYTAAKEFHPDRHLSLPSETLKNKLNAIFSYLTEGYKILSDSKMRMSYDHNLSNKPAKKS